MVRKNSQGLRYISPTYKGLCFFLKTFYALRHAYSRLNRFWSAISQTTPIGERRCLFYVEKNRFLTLTYKRSKSAILFGLQILTGIISRTVRDRKIVSIEVKQEVIYGLSNDINFLYPRWPSGVKGQGKPLKISKSNISKTVRDREMVSIEVK